MHEDDVVTRALGLYRTRPDMTVAEIAAHVGVPTATMSYWLRRDSSVERRSRGRRKLAAPTLRQRHILALAKVYSYADVGRMVGHSRSDIWRLVGRWGMPDKAVPPFTAGDRITFSSAPGAVVYKVVEADLTVGTVINEKTGQTHTSFSWWRHKAMARKVP